MNKSITQDNQNDNQISKSIRRFFTRFHLSSALKSANAYKKKGISAALIFQYLFLLIFSNRSMYMNLLNIEVFFKVCKSYLNLSKEYRSISYDAMTAHTAIVFTRYMLLSLENRESSDTRSMGELFLYFSDEMSDITWIQAFQILLQMFRTLLADQIDISDEKIDELVDAFMDAIPALLKSKLQAA